MERLKISDARLKAIFCSVAIGMIIAHGVALFNKFAIHDELMALFNLGVEMEVGRWGLTFLRHLVYVFFGKNESFSLLSMPLITGLYGFFFISIAVFRIVKMLDIKSPEVCALLGLVFVTYPFMAILFAFNFVAAYYTFAFYLSVLGAYWICCVPKKTAFWGGIFAIVFSLSIYQAFFPITLSMILIYMMKEVYDQKELTIKAFFLKGLVRLGACAAAVAIYLLINTLCSYFSGVELRNYQAINQMGQEGLLYLKRIKVVYSDFFNPAPSFRLHTLFLYQTMLFLCSVLQLARLKDETPEKASKILFLTILFPLAVNFIYIMCPHDDSYFYRIVNLSVWCGHLMVFVLFAFLADQPAVREKRALRKAGYVCFALMALMSCRIDNMCYFQATFRQQRMISYFTTLITQIKNAEGYKDEYPVVYLNEFGKNDSSVRDMPTLEPAIPPYWGTRWAISSYAWKEFMSYWCAYAPVPADKRVFEKLPEVQAMPHYPDDGSIKVVNNTVVVKF